MSNNLKNQQIHPCVLLTGAGFTHNFGGYLASQFWEHIFNLPITYKNSSLQQILKAKSFNYDFEKIYSVLREKGGERFSLYMCALEQVYTEIDNLIQGSLNQHETEISLHDLRRWLGRFGGKKNQSGFIFTLNQDLFFERHGGRTSDLVPGFPCAPTGSDCSSVQKKEKIQKLKLDKNITFEQVVAALSHLNIIKLHGSCNWISSIDDSGAMALGLGKRSSIEEEPLFSIYLELFEKVLLSGSIRQLWIVGYGYSDPHINSLISSAAEEGVALMSIHPYRPDKFFKMLREKPEGVNIARGICGHYPNTLKGPFPWSTRTFLGEKINAQMDLAIK